MDEPAVVSPAPIPGGAATAADRESFARLLAEVLQKVGETREIRFTPTTFQLVLVDPGGGGGSGVNLASLFDVYRNMPEAARSGWLESVAREVVNSTPLGRDLDAVRSRLLPVLRGRTADDRARTAPGADASAITTVSRFALTPHHHVGVTIPTGSRLDEVDAATLRRWNVSAAQVFEVARANLAAALPTPFEGRGPGLFGSESAGGDDATRLVLTDRVRALGLKGQPVAITPHAGLILISGTEEDAGLDRLAALATLAFEHPDAISGVAVELQGERWVPWLPPAGHATHGALDDLAARSVERDHAEQKVALEARLRREGRALLVATYALSRTRGGRTTSTCTWTRGVPALLPRTDELILVDRSRPPLESFVAVGSWERIVARVGHRMKPQGLDPERWEVTSFPDQAELDALNRPR